MRCSRGHLSACLGAFATRLSADAAVVHVLRVTLALPRARITGHRARLAQLGRQGTTARHCAYGGRAGVGAVAIEPDAWHHHLDVALIQTGVRAHLAGHEARDAGLDAVMVGCALSAQIDSEFDSGHGMCLMRGRSAGKPNRKIFCKCRRSRGEWQGSFHWVRERAKTSGGGPICAAAVTSHAERAQGRPLEVGGIE